MPLLPAEVDSWSPLPAAVAVPRRVVAAVQSDQTESSNRFARNVAIGVRLGCGVVMEAMRTNTNMSSMFNRHLGGID